MGKSLEELEKVLVFGHLAIGGALHNISGTRYRGALTPNHFRWFQKTFTGHFHVHQELGDGNKVLYIGSPMQFNFGDALQKRGIVLYNPDTNTFEHIENPYGNLYVILNETDISDSSGILLPAFDQSKVAGKHIRVRYGSFVSNEQIQSLRGRLLDLGALSVDHQMALSNLTRTMVGPSPGTDMQNHGHNDLETLVEEYLKSIRDNLKAAIEVRSKKRRRSLSASGEPTLVLAPSADEDPAWLSNLLNDSYFADLMENGKTLVREVSASQGSISQKTDSFDGNIARIEIENFMSITGLLTLDLREMHNGLWLIEGPNGSGKSTLFEAITWAHFGKFLRSEMSANDCVNLNAKECRVKIVYESGFELQRLRKRGSSDQVQAFWMNPETKEIKYVAELERGEIKVTQQKLESLFGIDYETFTKTVVMSATTVHGFLSGSPMQRRGLIEELMGLSHLDLFFESATKDRVAIEREIAVKIESRKEKENSKKKLAELVSLPETQEGDLDALAKLRLEIVEIGERHSMNKQSVLSQLRAIEAKRTTVGDAQDAVTDEVSLKNQLEFLRNLIQRFELHQKHRSEKDLHEIRCPTCEQTLPHDWTLSTTGVSTTLSSINPSAAVRFDSSVSPEAQLLILRGSEEQLESQLRSLTGSGLRRSLQMSGLELEIANIETLRHKAEAEYLTATSLLQAKVSELELKLKMNSAKMSGIQSQIDSINSDVESINQDISTLNERYNLAKFWENAFEKRVRATKSGFVTFRSYVFGNAVRSINELLEVYASQLASAYEGGDFYALDATLDENLDLKESYGRRSSGERKRTDLALLLSLFDIARQRSGYQSKYLLLDEVFDALDQSGRTAVQAVLSTLAEKVPKIFLISHSDVAVGASLAGTIRTEMARDSHLRPLGTKLKTEEY